MTVGALFFDLFGTLLSLEPLDEACEVVAPGAGRELALRWRRKQLELSWLRTLVGRWADFDVVTRDALRAVATEMALDATDEAVSGLADSFARLPPASEAKATLAALRSAGLRIGILTNASASTLARIVDTASVEVDYLLSADEVQRFKPDPAVYQLALDASGSPGAEVGFVTANGWDAAGASAFGLRVWWLRNRQSMALPAIGAPQPPETTWEQLAALFA